MDEANHVGAGGTIHMSPILAAQLGNTLNDRDGKLYTEATDALVIVGNYPPTHIFAHVGEIDVYLGEIFVTEANDGTSARSNEVVFRAERYALAAWNACAAAKVPFSA